jgi:hypothetical protein
MRIQLTELLIFKRNTMKKITLGFMVIATLIIT